MKIQLITGSLFIVCVVCGPSTSHNEDHKTHQNFRKIHYQKRIVTHHETVGNRSANFETLEIYYNESSSLIGFLNSTSHVAIIFSYSSNSFIILNGDNGHAVAFDSDKRIVLKVDHVWVVSEENFETFFRSLSSLHNLMIKGEPSKREDVAEEVRNITVQLGIDSYPLESLQTDSKILVEIHNVLKVLIKTNHFQIRGGLHRYISIIKGINDVFQGRSETVGNIFKSNTSGFDSSVIINAPSGIQALLTILDRLSNLGMSSVVNNSLSNFENLLKIIVELGGNYSGGGIDNIIRIIYSIVELSRGRGSIDTFIQILLDTGQNGGIEINNSEITPMINKLEKLQGSSNNSRGLNVFIHFLRDLSNNNLIFNNTNISRFLTLMKRGNFREPIDMIIRVLLSFNDTLNPSVTIPRFFGYLLNLYNTSRNFFPANLIPGLDLNQMQTLQKINITQLLQNREELSNISQIPVIGQIYSVISSSVGSASNGSMNFLDLLKSSGGAANLFSNFEHSVQGIVGGLGYWLGPFQNLANSGMSQMNSNPSGGGLPQFPFIPMPFPIYGAAYGEGCNNSTSTSSDNETTTLPTTRGDDSQNGLQNEDRKNVKKHHGHARKETKNHHAHAQHHGDDRKHHQHEKHHQHDKHERTNEKH